MPRPNVRPSATAAVIALAASPIEKTPGIAGARRATVAAAKITMPATHSQDQISGVSSSMTSVSPAADDQQLDDRAQHRDHDVALEAQVLAHRQRDRRDDDEAQRQDRDRARRRHPRPLRSTP